MSYLLSNITAYIFSIIKSKAHYVGEVCRLYEGNENVHNIVTTTNKRKRWLGIWWDNIKIDLELDTVILLTNERNYYNPLTNIKGHSASIKVKKFFD
jgi:hypothetical protein